MANDRPKDFFRRVMVKTVIAPDLVDAIDSSQGRRGRSGGRHRENLLPIIIEFDNQFSGGRARARDTLLAAYLNWKEGPEAAAKRLPAVSTLSNDNVQKLRALFSGSDELFVEKSSFTDSYAFGRLSRATLTKLANWPRETKVPLIYKIWFDHDVSGFIYESGRTIKCDAARASFAAAGHNIIWAVADTGIHGGHPHFGLHKTFKLPDGLKHRDFTREYSEAEKDKEATDKESEDNALTDDDGHGTHVAGIIAGETRGVDPEEADADAQKANADGQKTKADGQKTKPGGPFKIRIWRERRESDDRTVSYDDPYPGPILGLAPCCKLLSLKVMETRKQGKLSNILAALGYLQRLNDYGRNLRVHGVNLSLGYSFKPEWFAAGQSPLCVEVDRLVRSGVVVVAAAGNAGYGTVTTLSGQAERASHAGTISDPGNAAQAITVGSTHRDMPHAYGVSYFSAKGPTADGRMKPDLVAPGERIVSCAVLNGDAAELGVALFREDSGTSMAAPHVSGAIAAFLSVRTEFKGRPEEVKQIFISSATDLKRRPEYQGAGLVDLMRALQAV